MKVFRNLIAQQLSPELLEELCERLMTSGPITLESIKALGKEYTGEDISKNTASSFKNGVMEDFMARIRTARKAADYLKASGVEMDANELHDKASAAIGQETFLHLLEHGASYDLSNPEDLKALDGLSKITARGQLGTHRLRKLESDLKAAEAKAKLEAEKAEQARAVGTDATLSLEERAAKMEALFGKIAALIVTLFLTFGHTNAMASKVEQYKGFAKSLAANIALALAMPNKVQTLDEDTLRAMVQTHTLGVNANGWRNPYPIAHPFAKLYEYQARTLWDKSRFKMGLQSRQTGKDFTYEAEAVEDCYLNPGTCWLVAAPSERQSLGSLEKAKDWARDFNLAIDDYAETREGNKSNTLLASATITWSNGSKIKAVPGKPDTVRGESANVLITEFDFLEKPEETWKAVLPSITNPLKGGEKKARLISTPNGMNSAMHKLWNKPDGKKMKWSKHFVTIYHAVLMGLPVDVEELREAMDNAEAFEQEFLCKFIQQASAMFPYDLIAKAESLEASMQWTLEEARLSKFKLTAGIDFGRTSDPSVMSLGETALSRTYTRHIEKLHATSTPDQVRLYAPWLDLCSRITVDYTGPGIGFGDMLVEKYGLYDPTKDLFGKVELVTFTAGVKRAIFPALKLAMDRGNHFVPYDVELREDFHAVQQVIRNGEYSYEAPRTKDGHSDICTSQALLVRSASGPTADHSTRLIERPSDRRGMSTAGGMFANLLRRSKNLFPV